MKHAQQNAIQQRQDEKIKMMNKRMKDRERQAMEVELIEEVESERSSKSGIIDEIEGGEGA